MNKFHYIRSLLVLLIVLFQLSLVYSQELTLLFAGDAMQHQMQLDNARQSNGHYDYSSYFKHIQQEISAADLAIVNLEVTLGGSPYKGYPMFSAPDEYAIALKKAGFDIFLTANNHCLDRFSKGLNRTIKVLDSLETIHTGTFRNSMERNMFYPKMITRNGIRLAFLNYTYDTNGIDPILPTIVNYIDDNQMLKDIAEAKELNADFIIVAIHWGEEYKLIQNKEQERIAKLLTEAGVDLVIGGHPHVVQPTIVSHKEDGSIQNIVVYSLGNFISGMKAANTYGGQLVKVILSKNMFQKKITDATYSLVYVNKNTENGKTSMELLPVPMEIPAENGNSYINYKEMETFAHTSRQLFKTYNKNIEENSFQISTYRKNIFPASIWNM